MGTNFYTKHIPTELEYAKMQEALSNRQLDRLQELLDRSQKKYHIGKRSCGWQFLFCPHIKSNGGCGDGTVISPWEDTLESIKGYLSLPDVKIVDEYGTEFTVDQFFNEEIGDCLYHDKDKYINGEDYERTNPYYTTYKSSSYEYTTKEGLRFSKDSDFL